MKKWTDAEIELLKQSYKAKPLSEISKELGRSVHQVRNKLWKLGISKDQRKWKDHEVEQLRKAYSEAEFSDDIKLDELAEKLGRLKSNVSRKARELGLTDIKRKGRRNPKIKIPMFSTQEERSAYRSKLSKEMIANRGHPRGFLGGKHTDEAKKRISEKSIENYAKRTQEQRIAISMKAMKTRADNDNVAPRNREKASWKSGWRDIGGVKKYYRSRWEANYARYLEWLKQLGQIERWQHEPKTFWFDGVKRGCVSYLPDFVVVENGGSESYHEVKGWMDDRSKTKIKRMAKYHPDVKLIVIQEKQYNEIKRKVSGLIEGWE